MTQIQIIIHNVVPFANYRWRTCVGAAKGSLANAIGALYVRKFFNEEAKQSAVEMVHDIRAEFDFILHNIDWMDDLTKSRYSFTKKFLLVLHRNSYTFMIQGK